MAWFSFPQNSQKNAEGLRGVFISRGTNIITQWDGVATSSLSLLTQSLSSCPETSGSVLLSFLLNLNQIVVNPSFG
jgi:hypothetical protein